MISGRLPDDSERLVVLGHTGSGKTFAGAYNLARRSWNEIPWFIMDAKRDALLGDIGAEVFDIRKKPTRHAGLYRVPFDEGTDDAILERFMRQVCDTVRGGKRQGAGLFFDEGYSVPKGSPAFRKILTQGRSLRIPCIINSQRPVWMDRYAWSEASIIQYFHLTDDDDRKTVRRFSKIPTEQRLPRFHSYWWQVSEQHTFKLQPVPDRDSIRALFRERRRASHGGSRPWR